MQILILGMHRSGTSAVARLLNTMGAYFAPEGLSAYGANQENPKGFWERRDVRTLNDQLLYAAKADWHRLGDFALESIPELSLAMFRKEAAKIVLSLDAHRPWFIKEPRLCDWLRFGSSCWNFLSAYSSIALRWRSLAPSKHEMIFLPVSVAPCGSSTARRLSTRLWACEGFKLTIAT